MTLHHAGYVVASIDQARPGFLAWMGAGATCSQTVEDAIQRVKVAFLTPGGGAAAPMQIELVEPAGAGSPVLKFLEKGGGLHHLCYEVDSLEAELARVKKLGAVLIRAARPAVAFDGRRIAWIMTPERLLVEYLERDPGARR